MNTLFDKKGNYLELRTAAYFQSHGYLVRRGVMLSVAAGTADATDIDLLAIRFNVPLAEEKLIADCKDRKKPRPFERVLWTLGVSSFAQASQSVVVLPRAIWQVREFANQGGIQVLEAFEIERYLKSVNSTFEPFSDADPLIAMRKEQVIDRDLYREGLRLRQMLVVGHPLTNLNRIIKSLSMLGPKFTNGADKNAWMRRYICFDAAVIAAVMLVRFAAETKWTPEKDWIDYARKKLTYGDISPQKAKELTQFALGRSISEGIPAPPYADEVIRVIDSLIANPRVSSRLPYYLDYHLFGNVPRSSMNNKVSPNDLDTIASNSIRLGRRVLSALSYAAGLQSSVWDISTLQEQRTPAVVSTKGSTASVSKDLETAKETDNAKPQNEDTQASTTSAADLSAETGTTNESQDVSNTASEKNSTPTTVT
jgi:hypothetical protein